LRQGGEEELVDDACTRDANRALLVGGWMSGHHHAAQHALGPHRHVWAVVEAAHDLAFWTLLELIGRQVQTRLDQRMIEYRVLFATRHEGETGQISEHGSRPILSIESQQGACLWKLVRREVTRDGRERLAQFLPVAAVAAVAKRAEPLVAMGLTNDGAGAHHLSALAPFVARSTDVIQPAKGWGQLFGLGQGALASCLARPVDVKDHPGVARSIQQSPGLLLVCGGGVGREWATLEIIEKERAQGFDWRLGERRQKARERRAGWELVTVK
jgi:hypothetical protein